MSAYFWNVQSKVIWPNAYSVAQTLWLYYFQELLGCHIIFLMFFISDYLLQNTSKPVQMMTQCSSFSFTLLEDLQAKIVGIPYKNSDLSMFVLLPNDIDGLEKVNLDTLYYIIFKNSVLHLLYPGSLGTWLLNKI